MRRVAGGPVPRSPSSTGPRGSTRTSAVAALVDRAALIEKHGPSRPDVHRRRPAGHGRRRSAACSPSCPRRVLGQYEIFGTGGRLLLVAPNIVAAERQLGVDPGDFRLWVCLHEVTHRTQFTAVPVAARASRVRDRRRSSPPPISPRRAARAPATCCAARRRRPRRRDDREGLLADRATPEQRAILDRVTAVMSLLEGHAEYVMDGVGPAWCRPSRTIRKRFAQRRGPRPLDRVVRRLLGLDMKLQQYAEGAAFVRGVVDGVGMDGFNRVWDVPRDAARRRRSPTRGAGSRGCTADPPSRLTPRGRQPPGGRAVRAPFAPRWPAPAGLVLVACSGRCGLPGAGRGASRSRRPRPAVAGRCRDRRPRAAAGLGRARPRTPRRLRGLGLDPVRGRPRRRRRGRRPRGGGPCRPLRRAGRRRPRPARRGPARPHPRRPGRDRAARAGPWLGRALARRHGAWRPAVPAPAARPPPGDDRAPPAPRWACRCGTTRTTPTRAYARVRVRREVLPVLEAELGAGRRRGAGPHRRRCCATTPTPSTGSAAARARRPAAAERGLRRRGLAGLPAAVRTPGAARRPRRGGRRPRPAGACTCRRRRAGDRLARAGTGRPAGRGRGAPGVWQAGPPARPTA